MKKPLLQFQGKKVRENAMVGTISSKDLIDNFSKDWIPEYQRSRVMNNTKIKRLINIYKNNGHIDAIKINFKGEMDTEEKKQLAVLQGDFSVIDGQQRLYALKDSGQMDIKIPVELYINLTQEEEIKLFHQYNRDATKLKFGDLIKSTQGSYGEVVRRLLKRNNMAVPICVQSGGKQGLGLNFICPLMYQIHKLRVEKKALVHHPVGGIVINFFETKNHKDREVQMVEYTLKKFLSLLIELYGTYDNRSPMYKVVFLKPLSRILMREFMQEDGSFELGKFYNRLKNAQYDFMNNSYILQLMQQGGKDSLENMEIELINYLNAKMRSGKLDMPPRFTDIDAAADDDEE